jgi:exopolysaccharide biosynthesis WecB/TagA/CpsF family protein
MFFLGGDPGIAEKARDQAQVQCPGLSICGVHHGYFSADEDDDVVATIRGARTDILLVGLGQPKQEKWIDRNLRATGAKVAMGIGALFDYHAGKTKRAPIWMRRMGLEWLGRLIPGRGEPRRLWRRYLFGNVRFLWLALVHGVQVRYESRRLPAE